MSKLMSSMDGKVKGSTVTVQEITKDDELIVADTVHQGNKVFKELDVEEEFPRYQMLYEYFTCSYFTAI